MVKSRQGGFDTPEYTPGPRQAVAERPEVKSAYVPDPKKYERTVGLTKAPPAIEVFNTVGGYENLARVLAMAYHQSAIGKGKERHAESRPFKEQPIMQIPQSMSFEGGLGGLSYQITKKNGEADRMCDREEYRAAMKEMLGVMVYAAAKYLHIEKQYEATEDSE